MADKEVRLIDKDKLIKKINAEIDAWGKSRMCMTADELLETIEEFEEEAQPDNGWISVDDRLPELYENVLVTDSDGKIYISWIAEITETKSYFAYGSGSITHWQYLPEPPKGE